MITPNLNPAQLARVAAARPQSASLRTPRGGTAAAKPGGRDGQATPRLPANPEAPAGEEEPWLFSFERCLTTQDMWRMGFSRVIVFGAHRWVDGATAASELSEAFRCREPIAGIGPEHKAAIEAAIAPAFLRGDVLIAVQCASISQLPPEQAARCFDALAKLVDCVSSVWMTYDEMGDPDLGAVVVVLEGFERTALAPDWDDVEASTEFPVTPLDEELSVFFK